jgi:hypothetical protein
MLLGRRWLYCAAGVLAFASPAALAAGGVDQVVLSASQVGPGYHEKHFPGEDSLRGVTLDVCGFTFKSESLRTQRLQLAFVRHGRPFVSNEVVTYQAGGGQQALQEISHAVTHCPRGPRRGPTANQVRLRYRIKRLSVSGLAPGSVAIVVHEWGLGYQRQHVNERGVAIYQLNGDTLSAVYTSGKSVSGQLRVATHAAREAAKNLSAQ